MDTPNLDTLMRVAALERVRGLNEIHDHLTARVSLSKGTLPTGQSPARHLQAAADAVLIVDQNSISEAGRQGLV
jgi:hypothetical protein